MPTLLSRALEIPPPQVPPRKRWTREQYAPLVASGLFQQEKLELVDGELISKMGKNRPHVICLTFVYLWLIETFGKQFVNSEAPIDVSPADNQTNEPEPDIIVLNREFASFLAQNPQPADIRLLVEISDSTLKFDLTVKAALYARAGIVEYWVLDIAGRQLYRHLDPESGEYASVAIYGEHEFVTPRSAPTASFCPAQAFGEIPGLDAKR